AQMFLREYIDKLFEETSKVAKKEFGSMKTAVEEACRRRTNSSTNLSVIAIDDND
ncbi:10115_t:CDS:2, partial [Funneliformis caledonium]